MTKSLEVSCTDVEDMMPKAVPSRQPISFLDPPAELRNRIYAEALEDHPPIILHTFKFPCLLQTCRQVLNETSGPLAAAVELLIYTGSDLQLRNRLPHRHEEHKRMAESAGILGVRQPTLQLLEMLDSDKHTLRFNKITFRVFESQETGVALKEIASISTQQTPQPEVLGNEQYDLDRIVEPWMEIRKRRARQEIVCLRLKTDLGELKRTTTFGKVCQEWVPWDPDYPLTKKQGSAAVRDVMGVANRIIGEPRFESFTLSDLQDLSMAFRFGDIL